MIRMKSRNQSPVNGWQFFQAQTGWNMAQSNPQAQWSFDTAVKAIIDHRTSNPRFGLPTDMPTVANELDYVNALRVSKIPNAESYIVSDQSPPPLLPAQHPSNLLQGVVAAVRNVAAGGQTLVDWIKSGADAVPQELANKRASICATCDKNDKGDWTALFTVPGQNAIHKALEERKQFNLSTPYDDQLVVCSACNCPLKLKVHMGIGDIMKRMPKESFDDLVPQCWIRAENG